MLAGLLLTFAPAQALTVAELEQLVVDHLHTETRDLPGSVSIRVSPLANPGLLAPCLRAVTESVPGARSIGRTSVRLRCTEGPSVSLLVQANVSVLTDYLVSARPLVAGAALQAADVRTMRGDLAEMPAGTLTDPGRALGRELRVNLAAGKPLRGDLLKEIIAVRNGQSVKVVSRGNGFEVSGQGTALGQALVNEAVRVRLTNGQVVSGRARQDGVVEVVN